MLFNSAEFIFGFLPIALLGFFLIAAVSRAAALAWLALASLFFYAWWDPRWLPLLLASIVFNLVVGRAIAASRRVAPRRALRWLVVGVIVDLTLLGHYKYAGFVADNLARLAGAEVVTGPATVPELPLGISFFTFTQIAFLVDAWRGEANDFHPARYGLFVTYYPHLIAGPILHHKEMMPQFALTSIYRFEATRFADGLTIFVLGLFKKAVLADSFGRWAGTGFGAVPEHAPGFFEAWGAALAYTLQLYFDFSGYSDMAIGLALMIGVKLPQNFHSPYKATNIADFWRRWHMTLSRFLRDYLYIPLGGNRRGPWRRHANLFLTMLLGGIWHGAGWTFVVWGALHGLCLGLYHGWRDWVGDRLEHWLQTRPLFRRLAREAAWLLTFVVVVIGWVFFRAADLPAALAMLRGMAGLNGSVLPEQLLQALPALRQVADGAAKVPHLADGSVMGAVEMALMIAVGLAIVRLAPAMQELSLRARLWLLVPCGALALQAVFYGRSSEFLYFQF